MANLSILERVTITKEVLIVLEVTEAEAAVTDMVTEVIEIIDAGTRYNYPRDFGDNEAMPDNQQSQTGGGDDYREQREGGYNDDGYRGNRDRDRNRDDYKPRGGRGGYRGDRDRDRPPRYGDREKDEPEHELKRNAGGRDSVPQSPAMTAGSDMHTPTERSGVIRSRGGGYGGKPSGPGRSELSELSEAAPMREAQSQHYGGRQEGGGYGSDRGDRDTRRGRGGYRGEGGYSGDGGYGRGGRGGYGDRDYETKDRGDRGDRDYDRPPRGGGYGRGRGRGDRDRDRGDYKVYSILILG